MSILNSPSASVSPLTHISFKNDKISRKDFPADFIFGGTTSALQTEGISGGRGPATWDILIEGTTAADSLNRYKDDVRMLKNMSADSYRFSISWCRILPKGTLRGGINKEGVDFYNNFINELVKYGIEPFVTLFHYDLPQALQDDYKGILSRKIVDDFKDFAEICFREFGDRVKHWTTINEPHAFSGYAGYAVGGNFTDDPTTMPYIATHNTILAHATVVKLYKYKYQASQGGEIGLPLMIQWFLPLTDSAQDREAADRAWDFIVGWYLAPLVTGDYPLTMKDIVRERLPTFTEEEKELVKGAYDFIAVNYYTARYVKGLPINETDIPVSYERDYHVNLFTYIGGPIIDPSKNLIPVGALSTDATDISIFPAGLKHILLRLKDRYQIPKIYITENGTGELRDDTIPVSEALQDPHRIDYIKDHLKYVKEALSEGVNVKGYFVWTLIDGMAPNRGSGFRMGLNYIDYLNNLERIPKKSAEWYGKFITNSG